MQLLEEINDLADYMKPEEIANWFLKVIDNFEGDKISKIDVLRGFTSLSERQWHTYELINPTVKSKIEYWILQHWENDAGFVDEVCSITGALGLETIYNKIKELLHHPIDVKLTELIKGIVKEFGDSVADPYRSLK